MKKPDPFENYYYLGKIIKPHGYKGKVSAYLDTDDPGYYQDLKLVYLDMAGTVVPYFVSSLHILNNKAVFEFQDIDTLEKSEMLSKRDIYLPLSELPKLEGKRFYFHEVKGFTVFDELFGELGSVSEVLEYPNQSVLQIFHHEKEVLIPINDDIILEVDRTEKKIMVRAPEGLIGIYLG